jgi:hypothetical protein
MSKTFQSPLSQWMQLNLVESHSQTLLDVYQGYCKKYLLWIAMVQQKLSIAVQGCPPSVYNSIQSF